MTSGINNIVLIVIDALRVDRVGAYSDGDLTPNIDTLAKDGEVFENCFACINATDSSISTIFTGQYPTRHGVINHGDRVTEEEQHFIAGTTSLPSRIKGTHHTVGVDTLARWHSRGFETYINPRQGQLSPIKRLGDEFIKRLPESIENAIRRGHKVGSTINRSSLSEAEHFTEAGINAIDEKSLSFFLFLHYWDAHVPYPELKELPKKIQNREYEQDEVALERAVKSIEGSQWAKKLLDDLSGDAATIADLKRKYDGGVWRIDQAIGGMIRYLKDEESYDDTAIIVTSDHGESFTEHGIFFDHHGLYNPTLHVPLIIRAPGFEGSDEQFVQHFDLVPTILDLLDKPFDSSQFDGTTLVSAGTRSLDREAVFAEEGHTARKRAVRTDLYKYIKRLDDKPECRYCELSHAANKELYNLVTDPEEKDNIATEKPDIATQMDNKLDSWIEQLPDSTKQDNTFEADQEVKDHLEDMGYI